MSRIKIVSLLMMLTLSYGLLSCTDTGDEYEFPFEQEPCASGEPLSYKWYSSTITFDENSVYFKNGFWNGEYFQVSSQSEWRAFADENSWYNIKNIVTGEVGLDIKPEVDFDNEVILIYSVNPVSQNDVEMKIYTNEYTDYWSTAYQACSDASLSITRLTCATDNHPKRIGNGVETTGRRVLIFVLPKNNYVVNKKDHLLGKCKGVKDEALKAVCPEHPALCMGYCDYHPELCKKP